MTEPSLRRASPIVALALGWAIPGAGHAYAGRWGKAVLFFVCITGLLAGGLALGGGTVLVPDQLWYAAQFCAGGPALALTPISQYIATRVTIDYASRLREMGTLYTAIAGFLNLLVMMDAYVKLAYPHREDEKEMP